MQNPAADQTWTVPEELDGRALDAAVRALGATTWSEARRWIETGKVALAGDVGTDPTRRVKRGQRIELRLRTPRPHIARAIAAESDLIVYLDVHVVVVRKPAGISTIPFEDDPSSQQEPTLDALVRDVLARRDGVRGRAPLGVVQRLDKATSGLIVFTRTFAAKKHLTAQLRKHTVRRLYLAIAHGDVPAATHRSLLVPDRGDGLRGSRHGTRQTTGPSGSDKPMKGSGASGGHRGDAQDAVTHVEPRERLRGATLVACRLETGRTHQIRIHLSEAGHPLVGEKVYIRRWGGEILPAPRLMLHATELGFEHPGDERPMLFTEPPPPDFDAVLQALRARGRP